MSDFGAKASVPGYDVKTVADYLQLFNSSWPLIKVSQTGTYTSTVNHGLSYAPFHLVATTTGQVDQNVGVGGPSGTFGVNSVSLDRTSGVATPRYYIFRLSLTDNYTAPLIPGAIVQGTSNGDFGFKVTIPGKSITSTDLRDYSIHSSTRSPMLQKVDLGATINTGGGLGYERTVAHGLSYTPLGFAFILPGANSLGLATDRYYLVPPPIGVAGFYYTIDSTNVYVTADPFYFSSPPVVSIVVLKNPYTLEVVNKVYP